MSWETVHSACEVRPLGIRTSCPLRAVHYQSRTGNWSCLPPNSACLETHETIHFRPLTHNSNSWTTIMCFTLFTYRGRPLIIWGGAWCNTKKKKIRLEGRRKKKSFGGSLKKNLFSKIRTTPPRWLMVDPLYHISKHNYVIVHFTFHEDIICI